MSSKLDLNNIPKLVGVFSRKQAKNCYNVLEKTNWPLYLVGPSGSSKTITAMNLAKKYSKQNDVPAYYVQLSPELTKTSLILGLRLEKGSLVVAEGVVAKCMKEGGIIIVDEAPHGTQELLLMFNSILDRTSATSIGDKIIYAKETFRIIFCGNDSSYAGNIRLPQSFAQRLVVFSFDYPTKIDEYRIAKSIISTEFNGNIDVPRCVFKYVTSMVRELRTKEYPLSARNIAMTIALLSLEKKEDNNIDEYFVSGANVNAVRTSIAKKILGKVESSHDLLHKDVVEFIKFVSDITIDNFKKCVYSAFLYYIDIDGTELVDQEIKNKIQNSII